MVALALGGVGVLARWARLDRLELATYGSVLGVVIGSTLLVPLASWLGLRTPLILALAVLFAGGGWMLLRRRPPAAASAGLSLGVVLVLAAFAARWALLCAGALTVDAEGLRAGHVNIWGDWSQHLGDVTSFAFGDNFPPTHPRFSGYPLAYHYLTSVTVAAMVHLGLSPLAALSLHSFVFLCLTTLAVFAFARRLAGSPSAAALALTLFLLGGGLGFAIAFRDAAATGTFAQALWAHPWSRTAQEAANFRWLNVVLAYLLPQRAVLYGLPLGLLALTSLLEGVRNGGWRPFVIAGVVAGLLPLAHLGTLLALALIAPFILVLFPRREWVAFVALWAALAAPVFVAQQGGGGGALRHIHLQIGWIAGRDRWWFFWLKNLGAFLPLLVVSLLDREALPRSSARFLWAFMPVFVIANLVVFQPWDWDNTKVLLFWYLAGCVIVSATLVRIARREGAMMRVAVTVVVASLLLSGLLAHLDQALGRERPLMLTSREMQVAEVVRRETPPRALFLTGLQHNHPVPVLAGRHVVMSYPGWLWSQGIDAKERERDVRAMYALDSLGIAKLAEYRVDAVTIGPWERENLKANQAGYDARFRRAIDLPPYAVYEIRPWTRGRRPAGL